MIRVASAAVLIALLTVTIWVLPPWATVVVAAVGAAIAAGELARFSGRAGAEAPPIFVGLAAAAVTMAFVGADRANTGGAAGTALAPVGLALLVAAGTIAVALGPAGPGALTRAAVMMMAPVYVGLPLGAIAWVQTSLGRAATTWLVATIAVSDSAQYYTGRAFGRRKLAPAISPAKTVEGLLGGLVAASLLGAVAGPWALAGTTPVIGAGIGLGLAAFGVAGDLFESLLKRSAGVKDSSSLIPGHGGVLDRVDSYLFAAPVFYLIVRYLT